MNKIQFEKLLKPLIAIYDDIELELINNILDRLDNYSNVTGSLKWYLEKLADIGTLDRDNLELLKSNKSKIKDALNTIIKKAGTNINYLDTLEKHYKNGLIEVNPSDLNKSVAINNLINEALKDSDDIINLINTKAIEGAKENYRNILNKAYIETASGVYTYTESIRRAIDEMAKEGIKTVNYESGKHFSIESTVRRDVVTRVNKLVGEVEIQHAKELGTNLVYVDQHLGARVRTKYTKEDYEAHAEWQGKKYMIDGANDDYDNLYEKTGLGEMLGLKGINCYHDLRPTWSWEKIPDRIDEVENAKAYEDMQTQRAYERKIRGIKREILVTKRLDDKDKYQKLNNRFNRVNKDFNEWLKKNDRTRDYSREYIGIEKNYESERKGNNKESQINWKVVNSDEYKKKISITENNKLNEQLYNVSNKIFNHRDGTLKEDMYLLNGKNGDILASQTNMKTNLNITYNPQMKKAIEKNKNIIAIHNHPLSMPPSINDINSAFERKYKFGVVLAHDGTIYTYNIKKMKTKISQREYDIAVEKFTKMYYNNSKKGQIEALNHLSELYGFEIREVI